MKKKERKCKLSWADTKPQASGTAAWSTAKISVLIMKPPEHSWLLALYSHTILQQQTVCERQADVSAMLQHLTNLHKKRTGKAQTGLRFQLWTDGQLLLRPRTVTVSIFILPAVLHVSIYPFINLSSSSFHLGIIQYLPSTVGGVWGSSVKWINEWEGWVFQRRTLFSPVFGIFPRSPFACSCQQDSKTPAQVSSEPLPLDDLNH